MVYDIQYHYNIVRLSNTYLMGCSSPSHSLATWWHILQDITCQHQGSIWTSSSSTSIAACVSIVIALVLSWKNPTNLWRMATLIFFALSTLTSRLDEMLLIMFRSEGSASNGDLHSMNDISVSESALPHVCLACDVYLCCSTKINETLAVPLNHFLILWYASVRQAVGHYAVGAGMFVCLFWMQIHLTKHVK